MKLSTDVQLSRTVETIQWDLVQRQCKAFLESGFLPSSIKNIAQAVTIAWKGHELGWPPLYSFSKISVINGKPALEAEGMLALIYKRFPQAKVSFKTPVEKQHTECLVEMARPGGEAQQFRFTLDDAKRAGLLGKNTWSQYPAAMLRARAISAGARAVFPDAIMGMSHTPEELGADVVDVETQVETQPENAGGKPSQPTQPTQVEKLPFEEDNKNSKTTEWPKGNPHAKCTEAQIRRLYALGKKESMGHEELKELMNSHYPEHEHLEDMTRTEIQTLFEDLEKLSLPG